MRLRPLLVAAVLVLAVQLGLSVWAWGQIPAGELVPVHWDVSGSPDGFASKPWGLFGLPLITLAVAGLLAVVPRIEPRRVNLERSSKAYLTVAVSTLLFLAAVHVFAVLSATGATLSAGWLALPLSALFVAAGVAMRRIRPSWLFGFRTPWTLTSELSWRRTHEVGSRAFVAVGAAGPLVFLLGGPQAALWCWWVGWSVCRWLWCRSRIWCGAGTLTVRALLTREILTLSASAQAPAMCNV